MRIAVRLCLLVVLSTNAVGAGADPTKVATRVRPTFAKTWDRAHFDHGLLDRLLQRHVKAGRVDYAALANERATLDEYLYRVAETDPAALADDNERFAFYINAYNAVTLRAVLDRLPPDATSWPRFSVTKVKGFWKGFAYRVGRRDLTLDQIEHKILRPLFKRPRVHFAIVCASKGCPALASRVYRPATLKAQLEAAARAFFRRSDALRVEREKKIVYLSPLFQWFKNDFRAYPYHHELEFVANFVDPSLARFLRRERERLTIRYLPYDWTLNVK